MLLALAGCGRVVPHGGETAAAHKPRPRTVEGSELIPADLDLVVRLDLGKVRSSLGPDAARDLTREGLDQTGADGPVRVALQNAEVVWLGVRVADFREGDRVLVAETPKPIEPDPIAWTEHKTAIDGVARFESKAPIARGGTAEIVALGRSALFVSPVEAMSVARLIQRGPDADRGEPEARGLLSLDYHPRRVSAELRAAHPSLALLLGGVERVLATADVTGRELDVAARIHCKSELAADKLARFLSAFREAGEAKAELQSLLGGLKVERNDRTVNVRWPVASDALVAAWRRANERQGDGP